MRIRWLSLVTVTLLCFGCRGGSFSFDYHDHRPVRRVHRHAAHVCTYDCHDHYQDGTRLVVIRGHRHGQDCGHFWNGTYWVVGTKHRVHTHATHVCRRDCDHHYHDGTRLVVLRGHRHASGCGHYWNGTYWVVAAEGKARAPAHRTQRRTTHRGKHIHKDH